MLLFESACAARKEESRKYRRIGARRGKMRKKWKKGRKSISEDLGR